MTARLYEWMAGLARTRGMWVFKIYTWIVAAGFFAFYPPGVARGVRFYRSLFPEKNVLHLVGCVWRQYRNFTTIFEDRFVLEESGGISYKYEGWEHIEKALMDKTGGIVLMSHMGNWEAAARLLKEKAPDASLLLYMGKRRKEQMEKMQKESVARVGVKVVGIDRDGQSPFELIEGIDFLKRGGLVSMTGDRLWGDGQRTVSAPFLDGRAFLPRTPHVFALISGAPLFVFFAFRAGPARYRFSISGPIHVRAGSRADRERAVRRSAARYASLLERALLEHPLQWYHFGSFRWDKLERNSAAAYNAGQGYNNGPD